MDRILLLATAGSIAAGFAVALQGALNGSMGRSLNPFHIAFLVHIAGAIVSAVALVFLSARGAVPWGAIRDNALLWSASSLLGIAIITGASYAIARAGNAAGQAGLIFGQIVLAVLLDASGITGQKVPFTLERGLGLVLLGGALWLLLKR